MLRTEDLLRLEAAWRAQGAPIAGDLAPGLNDAEIDALLAADELMLPAELRRWWGWHDGVRSGVWNEPVSQVGAGSWAFLSLSEALEQRRSEISMGGGGFPADPDDWAGQWAPWWLPVALAGSAYLFADLSAEGEKTPIHLWAQQPDDVFTARFPSFGDVVAGWADGIERGFFVWSAERNEWDTPGNLPTEVLRLV
ncbi:SMI1/KNR4 family protein [Paractinoplanes toevensis]|nr:SMI1/KNR4 family protein [Actinoplanes toevensis]